ncbi:hypothetical protein [Wenjunlia tyrosinilytica]|uniref:Uncharacterized protein n=1 Tax=Wenjunlia tyrosinilytica TaxID=1544741 RepID=A0A918A0V2_9ACTN|nr:hypothetical protein [Wenjunlia tyrosinilytica]GGP01364.1 hypothetical protein GCM10012280_72040 [Wenjunlia tyrosinilytica]
MTIPGALAASMVDLDTGTSLGLVGDPPEPTGSWAGIGTAIVRASTDAMSLLGDEQALEELIISGTRCFHLLRLLPSPPRSSGGDEARQVSIHLALDRSRANLAMARLDLKTIAERATDGAGARPPPRQAPEHPDRHPADDTGGDQAPPSLPRRVPDRSAGLQFPPVHHEAPPGSLQASIASAIARPPDVETVRRIARALRELQLCGS